MSVKPLQEQSSGHAWFQAVVERVNRLMEERLTVEAALCPSTLQEAMRYACLGTGKRLRPALVCASATAASGALPASDSAAVWLVAAGVEMLHAFTLVHDDLPAMDDDDLRRGRPTVHKAFDEAMAILAGDALLARAFELLADPAVPSAVSARLIREMASGIGWTGVMAGQVRDIQAEGRSVTREQVDAIHRFKTAALMRTCCRCGALAVGAPEPEVERFGRCGEQLGLAFQALDDLMDEVGDEKQLGKRVRQDRALGKATLPAAIGAEATRQLVVDYLDGARACLQHDGPSAEPLRYLVNVMEQRLAAVG